LGQKSKYVILPFFIVGLLLMFFAPPVPAAESFGSMSSVEEKYYDGPYQHEETTDGWFQPYLEINGSMVSPMTDDVTDLTIDMCEGPQAWTLLKEFSCWKDVNRFGFYTGLGSGDDKTLIFDGIRNEGYVYSTMVAEGTEVGLWLHNDVNNDSIFSGNDSYLYSERSLTSGSGANEHQWFQVYDVSAYKGTGAIYEFTCPTEDFSTTGDFDYLIFIDDNHTSANFDQNDMILGLTCDADVPDECGNIQPGIPPNYYGIDTSYFIGTPALPLPPPDSGGVYVYLDTASGYWTIASHIYSKGNSLEQFHGNVVLLMDEPPELGVNIFIDNFELWHDTTANRCLLQNDRWGWSLWDSTVGLYEIWWDVTTREYKHGAGDLNDFLIIRAIGTALDFNIWSSGHEIPFSADEIYLGADMTGLSSIPGYYDYGGFDVMDQYQALVGSNPADDPNTSVFSRHCGVGQSYNLYGQIDSTDSYVCDSQYGLNFAGPWVYQADGIQFSTVGVGDPCSGNNPPICILPDDATIVVCGDTTLTFAVGADDPDENLIGCTLESGDGSLSGGVWSLTTSGPGVYSADFKCTDFCGVSCLGTVNITVNYNSAPVCNLPSDGSYFVCGDTTFSFPVSATDADGNLTGCTLISGAGTLSGGNWVFTTTGAGVYTATFECTDACGATCSGTVSITVAYNSAPVCNLPSDGSYFVCGDTTFSFPVSATDADGNLTGCTLTSGAGTLSGGNWVFTTTGAGVYTASFECTDACGATCSGTVNVTVNYNNPPVLSCPADVTIECDVSTDPASTGYATATDDNDPSPSITHSDSETAGSCPQEKTITRTWTATDNCGAVSQCQQTITVVDDTAPVITCPADITIECDESTDPANTGTATATDNCDPDPSVTYSDATAGNTITRTWTATDACGNSSNCVQTITIDDTTPPVITCPANVTVECDESTDPSNTGSATATDNCDSSPTVTYTDSETPGSCPQEKTITRTWTATDADDNSASCQQTITVVDDTAPVITCPTDITIECGQSTDPANTGTATAVDNCDTGPSVTYSDATAGNTITRTWTATDACGNSDNCVQTITIDDTTPPVITCPANVTIECDESTDPANTGTATATDNCDSSPTVTYTDSETAGNCPQEKTITRTWTATDADDNSASCQQTITVVDDTAPVISCPADITIECDESTDPANTGTATATDNCDPSPSVTYSDATAGNTITRTWTATDACGNSSNCVQTITIDDTTPPVVTCPGNVTIECDESTDPSNTGSATATDNCDPSPTVSYTDSETPGSCPQEKTITRTWTATDADDNSASCQQTITVVDDTAPVISCPADITIECDQSTDPANTGTATAVDNCDTSPSVTYSDATAGNTITRTWTATDACGNSSNCLQTITIDDTTPPVVTCPANVTIECDESTDPANTGTATATDNCDSSPTVTYTDSETPGSSPQEKTITRTWTATDVNSNSASCQQIITVVDITPPVITGPADVTIEYGESTDPSNTGFATAVDNCDPNPSVTYSDDAKAESIIIRTWTATDASGNYSNFVQTITIEDTTPPVVTCPANITIECDESTNPSNTGTATATDGCDPSPTVTYTDSETPGSCPQEKTITRTWTATDADDNSASCQQTITVVDDTAPVIGCPADITIECDQSTDPANTGIATAVDNCDTAPIVTFSDSRNGGIITRTWTATDACGNSSNCVQTITIDDTTPPVVTCPANVTIECDQSTDPANTGTATATDNCDPSPTVTYTDSETPGSCPQEKTITRTWTATDVNSNSASCQQTITVVDDTAPVITCPADITIECDESTDPSNTGTATAVDNCDPGPSVIYSDATAGNTITRTWTATDACGNSSNCVQTITIDDTTPPVITCPANVTIECDQSTDPANTGTATATDNCDPSPTVTYTDSETPGSCPQEKTITRTWTATDADDNSASCQQTITVVDDTAPVISCPADITIECDQSTDPANTGTATAADNCDTAPIVSFSDSRNGGIITRTWTATDACGNSSNCVQTITIDDTTPPVITCPANVTIECDESTDPANTGTATATDNCDSSPTVTYTDSETPGSCPQEKTITRTWTATDFSDNSTQCQQIITIEDNTPPELICPDTFIVECGDPIDPEYTGYPTIADNCDPNPTYNYSDSLDGTTVIRKWYGLDQCGNGTMCLQAIVLADNEPPVAVCPGDTTMFLCTLADTALAGFACTDPDDNIGTCDLIGGTLDGDIARFTPVEGVNTLTLIVQDKCGEVDSCKTNITVVLNEPPSAGDDYNTSMFVCNLEDICLSGFACSDPDDNLENCYAVGGTLSGGDICFTPTNGLNTILLVAVDECGAADTASITVDVTLNTPPYVTCAGDRTEHVYSLPADVCVNGLNCSDVDGNLSGCIVSVTLGGNTVASVNEGDSVCFTADYEGFYIITVMATDDCGATNSCVTEVFVKKESLCPTVKIEKTHNTYQGHYENVSITIENSQYEFEGFDFLIAYDASVLSAVEVIPGQLIEDCNWEYFTYRFGVHGNCGNGCPSGLLRIVAMAEMNNGAGNASCFGPSDLDPHELVTMRFLITNDRNFECTYVPISFFWDDCGDNSISGVNGDILYIDNIIYDFEGNVIWDEEDETAYPEIDRIMNVGAPDDCLNPNPLKPSAVRCIEFVFGGVDIICADSIDAPGDLNLNGVSNEIADAVVYTNYFVYGLAAFNINAEGQKAASDINRDGIILTVSDLVYLTRIICGDAVGIPKVTPEIETAFVVGDGVVSVDAPLGAAHIVIRGNAAVNPGGDAEHVDMVYRFDGVNTNVLIYSFDQGESFNGEILLTDGEIISIDAADYDGNAITARILPATFSLTGYPNPFNPTANIEMNLPVAADWNLTIYNVTGRKVAEFDGFSEAGPVNIKWDAAEHASGIYFFQARAGVYTATSKMILLK